jgi:hypothetical protein
MTIFGYTFFTLRAQLFTQSGELEEELTNTFTSFYQSLTASINQKSSYHPLPDQIQTGYFSQHQPLLGKVEESNTATIISAEHYQLLDQVIADFQEEEKETDEEDTNPVTQLQERAKSIASQFEELLKNKLDPGDDSFDANLMTEMFKLFGPELQRASTSQSEPSPFELMITKKSTVCQPFFKILLSYPASKPVVTEIKN